MKLLYSYKQKMNKVNKGNATDTWKEHVQLYEKMPESTTNLIIDAKHRKRPFHNKPFPTNRKFVRNIKSKKTYNPLSAPVGYGYGTNGIVSFINVSQIDRLWAVTEKVHGANFCFVYNVLTGSIYPAKRNSLLESDDPFFGYKSAYDMELSNMLKLFDSTSRRYPKATIIYAFAELFGGSYVHESIDEVVQTEIKYSPHLHFYHFDIAIQEGPANTKKYLDYFECSIIWGYAEVMWATPLYIGSFEEVTNCGVDFQTTIPSAFHLPALPDNNAEGIVVRPLVEIQLENSSPRVHFKRKASRFLEKVVETNTNKEHNMARVKQNFNVDDMLQQMLLFLNRNRVLTVRSKIGANVAHSILVHAVLSDILNTVGEELYTEWKCCLQKDQVLEQLEQQIITYIEQFSI